MPAELRRSVRTENAPAPVGAYSQAVMCGGLVFTAGQVGLDPRSGMMAEDMPAVKDLPLGALVEIEAVAGLEEEPC